VCGDEQEMNLFPEFIPVFVFINILVYFGFFAIGIGGLPWIIMSEVNNLYSKKRKSNNQIFIKEKKGLFCVFLLFQIFPINIKVSAGSIVALTSWTTGWFVSYGFNFMFEWSAQGLYFLFYFPVNMNIRLKKILKLTLIQKKIY
jgi:hypothetical protein